MLPPVALMVAQAHVHFSIRRKAWRPCHQLDQKTILGERPFISRKTFSGQPFALLSRAGNCLRCHVHCLFSCWMVVDACFVLFRCLLLLFGSFRFVVFDCLFSFYFVVLSICVWMLITMSLRSLIFYHELYLPKMV